MKTDLELSKEVQAELERDPGIEASKVGVRVNNGIVTLSGHVNDYSEKLAAEKAAKRIYGIKAVAQEIIVKPKNSFSLTDEDIAEAVLNSLRLNTDLPDDRITLEVEDGWVTLEGSVDTIFQQETAKKVISHLAGVKGVYNLIKISPKVKPKNIMNNILKALKRNATTEAHKIIIRVEGHKVTLEGAVQSWAEKDQAKLAAWSAPGVIQVVDNLKIEDRPQN
jgi:osmotically-inducible protein OsmY